MYCHCRFQLRYGRNVLYCCCLVVPNFCALLLFVWCNWINCATYSHRIYIVLWAYTHQEQQLMKKTHFFPCSAKTNVRCTKRLTFRVHRSSWQNIYIDQTHTDTLTEWKHTVNENIQRTRSAVYGSDTALIKWIGCVSVCVRTVCETKCLFLFAWDVLHKR